MEMIIWTDLLKNEEVLLSQVGTEYSTYRKTKVDEMDFCILRRKYLLKHIIEGKIYGAERRGRRHKQLLDDLKGARRYRS